VRDTREPHVGQGHALGDRRRAGLRALGEALAVGLGREAGALREGLGDALDQLVEAELLLDVQHDRVDHDLLEGVGVAQALLLEDRAQLGVEALVALRAEAREDVEDGAPADDAALAVPGVPADAGDDQPQAEEPRQEPHLDDQREGREHPEERDPGVERGAEARVVGLEAALAHHDHGPADQREHQELEGAGELRDLHRVEPDDDQHDDRGREQDPVQRDAATVQAAQALGGEAVAAHGERVARGRQDGRVADREEGQQGGGHDDQAQGLAADRRGGVRHRRHAGSELGAGQHTDEHRDAEGVDEDRGAEREEDPARQVALGVGHLLGDAGDLGDADVRDVDHPGRLEDRGGPGAEEALEVRGLDLRQAERQEARQDDEQTEHEDPLESPGELRPERVEEAEADREGHGEGLHGPGVGLEEERDVGAETDEGEARLEHEREPGADAADGADQRAEAALEEVVRPAGARHGGRELDHAEHGRHERDRREQVGEHHRRARAGEGGAWEEEEPGRQGRPGGQGEDVEQPQLLLEPAGGVRGGRHAVPSLPRATPAAEGPPAETLSGPPGGPATHPRRRRPAPA
jgi:hypothetical protein